MRKLQSALQSWRSGGWRLRVAVLLLGLSLGLWTRPPVLAGPLSDRLAAFPNWDAPPPGKVAQGELIYPDWFEGTWQATSTLRQALAPLAPEIVTPGFENNRQLLDQPVQFTVRFYNQRLAPPLKAQRGITQFPAPALQGIVADRRFNSVSLGKATLGEGSVRSVSIDPEDPRRLVTQFRQGQQLVSESRERATESTPQRWMTSELFQQTFRSPPQIYLNRVENTTDYHQVDSRHIAARQITAIYLSPQDPDFFRARNRPVALYQYELMLEKPGSESPDRPIP
ncbi:DUF6816 family protein [Lyngbya confervoides]|uniref:DUF6816 domain-containing protein n=1 Tax=Lyngbya confervoides BDU141951 TaxID=1574623 RepID=A0ABD4T352_9CYAN|nr:hypothetical protein [Lyngbya confervoides]MCM1983079.1 hypothetical protein [Lyngbya confervoides BDU141951]